MNTQIEALYLCDYDLVTYNFVNGIKFSGIQSRLESIQANTVCDTIRFCCVLIKLKKHNFSIFMIIPMKFILKITGKYELRFSRKPGIFNTFEF